MTTTKHPIFVIGELALAVEHRRRAQRELEGTDARQPTREARRQLALAEQELAAAIDAEIAAGTLTEEDQQ
jgi:hypothetical protein